MKKIGIIGTGVVAQSLAKGFLKNGYEIIIGSRDGGKARELAGTLGGKTTGGTFSDAAKSGEILVFCVKGNVAEEILRQCGLENLKGKTVIDTTNPIADARPVNGVLQFFTGPNDSLLERLQKLAPEANFVKSFSCVGNSFMIDPKFPDGKPSMFICGNSDSAKEEVNGILKQFGWDVENMGKVEAARAIEPLCILWCIPGLSGNQWTHAFKLLKM